MNVSVPKNIAFKKSTDLNVIYFCSCSPENSNKTPKCLHTPCCFLSLAHTSVSYSFIKVSSTESSKLNSVSYTDSG